jgi:hypothetical protein
MMRRSMPSEPARRDRCRMWDRPWEHDGCEARGPDARRRAKGDQGRSTPRDGNSGIDFLATRHKRALPVTPLPVARGSSVI